MLIRSRYSATSRPPTPDTGLISATQVWADQGPAGARLPGSTRVISACRWADDAEIVARVDDISEVMFAAMKRALTTRHKPWLTRYGWSTDLVIELLEDEPGEPLDG